MSKKASNFQKKVMSFGYRGKEIFKPLNTGWIDEHVACVREWIANIFFYTKNGTTIMIDAGYNYDRLQEKMTWLDIDPSTIRHILITHQDTDHVGAVETDSDGLFQNATLYLSEIENKYPVISTILFITIENDSLNSSRLFRYVNTVFIQLLGSDIDFVTPSYRSADMCLHE